MRDYELTLVIEGRLDDDRVLDRLSEAGCDDPTFAQVGGVGYGDFIREAPDFGEAVRSAIEPVESVPGLRVVRVEFRKPTA
jgi:hypothetical protein